MSLIGLVHMVMHDTTMMIPIRNSIFENKFQIHLIIFSNQKKTFS